MGVSARGAKRGGGRSPGLARPLFFFDKQLFPRLAAASPATRPSQAQSRRRSAFRLALFELTGPAAAQDKRRAGPRFAGAFVVGCSLKSARRGSVPSGKGGGL